MSAPKILKIIQVLLILGAIGFGIAGMIELSALCVIGVIVMMIVRWIINDRK